MQFFANTSPEMALAWEFAKNEGTPGDHSGQSLNMAWWMFCKRERLQQSIDIRSSNVDRRNQRLNTFSDGGRERHPAELIRGNQRLD